jgi:hypothetical protein
MGLEPSAQQGGHFFGQRAQIAGPQGDHDLLQSLPG